MTSRKPTYEALRQTNRRLQQRVAALEAAEATLQQTAQALQHACDIRTADLEKSRQRLLLEVDAHAQTEAALQRRERQYRRLFHGAPIAYLTLDLRDGRLLQSNRAAARLLGDGARALEGSELRALFPDARQAELLIRHLQQGQAIARDDLRIRTRRGESRWVNITAEPIKEATGNVREARLMVTDVTASRRAARLLKASEERFRAIANYTYGWESWLGTNGRLLWVNPAVRRITGYDVDECLAMEDYPLPIIHPEDRRRMQALFRAAVANRTPGQDVEFRIVRKAGDAAWVAVAWLPIFDSDGQFIGFRASIRDISGRKRAEDLIKAANQELERKVAARTAELQDLRDRLQTENIFLRETLEDLHAYGDIIGEAPVLRKVIQQIELVAPTDASVLILGESGTGKELVAREIHRHSRRAAHPMIKVNCATIPKELYESEFFGHVRGAFTGATRERAGRFEAADGGTLFLDEVGEIPLELQGKLLRVLQEGEYERIGEERTRKVDVRVIAASNQDLQAKVAANLFREDLYYRLNVFPILVPPLRARKEDILPLAEHFLAQSAHRMHRPKLELSRANLADLLAYGWPGNVRELQNAIERAVILSASGRLRFDLEGAVPHPGQTAAPPAAERGAADREVLNETQLLELQRDNIRSALIQCRGKIYGLGGAARLLAIKPTTLIARMKRFGIDRKAG